MTDFHNLRDTQIIQVLRSEHNQVRKQLQRLPGFYDPTESHAEIIRDVIDAVKEVTRLAKEGFVVRDELRRENSYLKSQVQALELEKKQCEN